MKRGLALFLAAVLTALALTACGGSDSGGDAATSASSASADSAPADYESYEAQGGSGWIEEPAAGEEQGGGEADDRLANAKLVYSANIDAETRDFDACAAGLEALVEQMGGYIEYAAATSYADGYRSGNYTVRVPAGQFSAFLKGVGNAAHITDQSKSAENISEKYYDTESRLATQQTKLDRLQALLAQAENMEDIITIESAISETELEIEQLTGSLRRYDALVDYATVQIYLREVPRLTEVEETAPSFLSRLGSAFTGGLRSFGDFLQGLAILLAYNWTWLLLLAAVILLAVRHSRRRQARQEETFGQPKAQKSDFFRQKQPPENPDDKQGKD